MNPVEIKEHLINLFDVEKNCLDVLFGKIFV